MACYDNYVAKYGIPNEIYGNMTREDAEKEALQFMWCEIYKYKNIHRSERIWST